MATNHLLTWDDLPSMTSFHLFLRFFLVEKNQERKEAEAFLKQAEFQPGLLPARILNEPAKCKTG